MATRLQDKKTDLLERVADRVHDKLDHPLAALAEAFVQHYYRAVPPADLIDRDPLDLYGAALAHLRFGEHRQPGHAKVRVYNPQIEQHGWQSTHTIVEVVTDDMPFLVDSVSMALNRLGLLIHLTIHPVLPVRRDADGMLEAVLDAASGDGGEPTFESFMHVEVDRQSDLERLETIRAELERALGDVRAAVEDWRPMLGKIDTALADLKHGAKAVDAEDLEEAQAFLAWIADNHFTFLGYGCYDLIRDQGGDQLRRVEGSALGLLRRQGPASATSRSFAALPPEIRRQARDPVPLVITKANARSTVHRPVYLDYIGVRAVRRHGQGGGRAPVPRPVHLGRLQPQPAPHSAAPAQGRARDRSARTCRRPAIRARRWPTFSRPIRATSCSRQRKRSCSRSRRRSCICRSGRRSACSSGATRSPGSSRAWSTCRASATTPRSGAASRRSCRRRWAAPRWSTRPRSRNRSSPASSSSSAPRTAFRRKSMPPSSRRAWSRRRDRGPIGCTKP